MAHRPLTLAALLASLCPAAGAETALYGSIRLMLVDPAGERGASVDNSASRFGLRGAEEFGEGLRLGGRYEFGVAADKATIQDENRLAYVSIEGAFGEILAGRVWSSYWNANAAAWQAIEFGADGNRTTLRLSDAIKWTQSFGNTTLSALAQLDDGLRRAQASAALSLGALQLVAGLDSVVDDAPESEEAPGDGNDEDDLNSALSLSLQLGELGLNAVLNRRDDGAAVATGYNINAVYRANDNTFVLSYGDPDTDSDDDASLSAELVRAIGERSSGFLSIQDTAIGTAVALGLRHDW